MTSRSLARWVDDARQLLREQKVHTNGGSALDLLTQLESLQQGGTRFTTPEADFATSERELARSELRRLEKLQRSILQRVEVADVYDLESAIEEANARQKQSKLRKQSERELFIEIDRHEDAEEIRELLELHTAEDIRHRLDDLKAELSQMEVLRQQHSRSPHQPNRSVIALQEKAVLLGRELEAKRKELHRLEMQLQAAQRKNDQLERRKVVPKQPVVVKKRVAIPWLLSELTQHRFESMQFDRKTSTFLLRSTDGKLQALKLQAFDVADEQDTYLIEMAWVALQLRLAMIQHRANAGNVLPLALLLDHLAANDVAAIYAATKKATVNGLQITMLVSSSPLAERLASSGASVLRVGLTRRDKSHFMHEEDEWEYRDDEKLPAAWAA